MSLSATNLALTLSDIHFKTFVREGNEPAAKTKKKISGKLNFVGNEAKEAYNEIISHKSQRVSLPRKCNSTSENKSEIKLEIIKTANKPETSNINTLFRAIELGDIDFVMLNFSSKNVNISDQFGWTPLMSAAYSGHIEIVNFLLKIGANRKAKDKSGLKALDLAIKKNNFDIVELLKQNTSKRDIEVINVESDEEPDDQKSGGQESCYCDTCKVFFSEPSKLKHEASILHVFNSRPKLKNTFYGIPKQNKGYQMLLNTGWDEEGGLGPSGEGQKYPVKTILKRDRKGLGQSDKKVAKVTHFNPRDTDAVKSVYQERKSIRRKPFKRKDRERQLCKDAAKTRALRQAL